MTLGELADMLDDLHFQESVVKVSRERLDWARNRGQSSVADELHLINSGIRLDNLREIELVFNPMGTVPPLTGQEGD